MPSIRLGNAGVLALLLILVGCEPDRANVGINVINNPANKTLCVGGLKARGSYPGTTAETDKVLPDTMDKVDFITPEKTGTPLTVEAWCYGEAGEEVGYTKVAGGYRGGPLLSIVATPPLRDEPLPVYCNAPNEQRGEKICIQVSFIEGV